MLFMATKSAVRRVPDLFQAKLRLILPVLILCAVPALHGQQKQPKLSNRPTRKFRSSPRRSAPSRTTFRSELAICCTSKSSTCRNFPVTYGLVMQGISHYPLIPSKITAAGLTPFQLEQKMEQLLIENGLVTHPQVSVFVKEQNSQPVSVVGAVMKPMVYQLIRPTTLLELLADAGGIADDAGSSGYRHAQPQPRRTAGGERCCRDLVRARMGTASAGNAYDGRSAGTTSANHHDSAAESAGIRGFVLQHSGLRRRCGLGAARGHRLCHRRGNLATGRLCIAKSRRADHGRSKRWRWRTD